MSARTSLAQTYSDLAIMLDAGLPILRSLDVVIEGRKGYLKRVVSQVRESLGKGAGLAEALAGHRSVFPDIDRMLIAAAETSGSLPTSLKMLAEWHEFVNRITRRVILGLIYPFLILHVAAFVFGLPGWVLGRVTGTQFLFGAMRILMFLYVPTIIVVACVHFKQRVPLLRLPLDLAVLRIPVLGQAVYHMSVCRFAKAFNMMYSGGVPMAESTARATVATGNYFVERQFAGAQESVRQGGAAWEGLSERLPTEYRHLWQIGEETGELDQTTSKIAEIAADRADLMFKEFSIWLPRIVYFIIMAVLAVMIVMMASQVYGNMDIPSF
jgi:type IV pilus assembly protein PilC